MGEADRKRDVNPFAPVGRLANQPTFSECIARIVNNRRCQTREMLMKRRRTRASSASELVCTIERKERKKREETGKIRFLFVFLFFAVHRNI